MKGNDQSINHMTTNIKFVVNYYTVFLLEIKILRDVVGEGMWSKGGQLKCTVFLWVLFDYGIWVDISSKKLKKKIMYKCSVLFVFESLFGVGSWNNPVQ